MSSKDTGLFSSKWGLLMAALGAAIGTGNIWRFPREVANNGGGSFMIPYIIFLFSWSIPILLVEFSIGKKSRRGTIGSFAAFLGKEKMWMGAWMAWVSTAIGFYYAVVMGWTIRYALGAVTGSISFTETQRTWDSFLTSPLLMVLFQVTAIIMTAVLVYRGVKKGVERVNVVLIPIMFVLTIGSMLWAVLQPGGLSGVVYLFTPKVEYLLSAKTWIAALAQCAWSCSAGMGMAITFGAYSRWLTLFLFLFGLPSALIIAVVAGRPIPVFLDHQDYVWGMGLVLSGAFIYYLVAKYGISRFREKVMNSKHSDIRIGRWVEYVLKYVIPVEIVLLGGWYLVQSFQADPMEEWWVSGPISLGLLAVQWGLALLALWLLGKKLNRDMADRDVSMETSMDEDIEEEEAAERGEAKVLA